MFPLTLLTHDRKQQIEMHDTFMRILVSLIGKLKPPSREKKKINEVAVRPMGNLRNRDFLFITRQPFLNQILFLGGRFTPFRLQTLLSDANPVQSCLCNQIQRKAFTVCVGFVTELASSAVPQWLAYTRGRTNSQAPLFQCPCVRFDQG